MAWFLARSIARSISDRNLAKTRRTDLGSEPSGNGDYLDLATIGTITDMVPLLGPNRSLVWHGLKAVRHTRRSGLLALYRSAGIEGDTIGAFEIGYMIGPRLNASGRIDDPIVSLRLLCTRSKDRAWQLARKLDQQNRERQDLAQQTTTHARKRWLKQGGQDSLIFVHHRSYEPGVIGLVASKLKDEFYRPAVILAPRQDHWSASARSIEGFNIVQAVRACTEYIQDHGGHKAAAGFFYQFRANRKRKTAFDRNSRGKA